MKPNLHIYSSLLSDVDDTLYSGDILTDPLSKLGVECISINNQVLQYLKRIDLQKLYNVTKSLDVNYWENNIPVLFTKNHTTDDYALCYLDFNSNEYILRFVWFICNAICNEIYNSTNSCGLALPQHKINTLEISKYSQEDLNINPLIETDISVYRYTMPNRVWESPSHNYYLHVITPNGGLIDIKYNNHLKQ